MQGSLSGPRPDSNFESCLLIGIYYNLQDQLNLLIIEFTKNFVPYIIMYMA